MTVPQRFSVSQEQLIFSNQLLKDIFLQKRRHITPATHELKGLYDLYPHIPTLALKTIILSRLSPESQLEFMNLMTEDEWNELYTPAQDITMLFQHYKQLDRMNRVLLKGYIQEQHPDLYEMIKDLPLPDVAPTKPSSSSHSLDLNDLYTSLTDPEATVDDVVRLAESYVQHCSKSDLLTAGKTMVSRFSHHYAYIGNKRVFKLFLHLSHFLDRLVLAQPALKSHLKPLHEQLIAVLSVLNGSWINPIMKQVPLRLAEDCFQRLLNYERIPDFEKRNLYCKLLNKIKAQAKSADADYLRFLLSKG